VAAQHLTKGRQVGISGELRWREWEQDGNKRQAVEINGRSFTFVGSRDPGSDDGASAGTSDFAPATSDDDIPF
jgi:single-stranded DNA-binding protein